MFMIAGNCQVIMYNGEAESIHGEELTAMIGGFTQGLYSVIVRNTIEIGNEKYNASSSVQLLYSPYERSRSGLGIILYLFWNTGFYLF